MNKESLKEFKSLLEKIATELVFAEPDKDSGLLPVNCLLGQVEELIGKESAPEPMVQALQQARQWVDEVFNGTGKFTAPVLKRFGEWVAWNQAALLACENEEPLPDLPVTDITTDAADVPATAENPAPAVQMQKAEQEEAAINLNIKQDGELLREFINEAQEHLQNIEQGVLVLEDNPSDADTLNSIFRAFHTFKGNAGFLNLTPIQTLAHDLESLLDLARQHKLTITPAIINLILAGGDMLKQFMGEIAAQVSAQKPPAPIVIPTLGLLESIRTVLGQNSGKGTAPVSPTVVQLPAESVSKNGAASDATGSQNQTPTAIVRPETTGSTRTSVNGTAVKVDTMKLDSLVDLVGEMVIAQSLVIQNQDLAALRSEKLTRDLARLKRISKELQRTAMSLRMVPIRATFQKMNRLVRDSAKKVGKQVQLVTKGEDTELDRTIVEEISDPLIHMIRNSVDHGIEKSETRLQHGKPVAGTVSLNAFHQGGNIVIEIKDDGKGLDRERILAKAVERGLARPDDQLSDSEIFNFILEPGFSTAEKITDLSGRGVGMDVVQRNIEKLRGKIEIQSESGKGSTFSIFLPLTLAIIDGLLVRVGEDRYIVPTLSVCESFRLSPEMISTVQGCGEMVSVRGRLRPLLRLHAHLGIQPVSVDAAQEIVVVVEVGNKARCIVVDKLLGKQEVVIKSLDGNFSRNPYVAGAAILGDGRVGLILDPEALVNLETAVPKAAA